ncbi:MAG: hypothetical protein PHQ75_09195 [Thermoguttaceae bacterium]|nr:hypothetical protein [Thermoguttaceae bacterium]
MLTDTRNYIQQLFGTAPEIELFHDVANVPMIIKGNYTFYKMVLNSVSLLLMVDRHKMMLAPSGIEKYLQIVHEQTGLMTVFVTDTMPSWQRQRLIARKIQFIVPDKQLFLPSVGVVLSDKKESPFVEPQKLAHCAQEILLMVLNGFVKAPISQSELYSMFSCSRQTFYMALSELEYFAFLTKENRGKSKVLRFPPVDSSFFEQAGQYLENPVKKTVGIDKKDVVSDWMFESGMTLLSQRTMIAEQNQEERAISLTQFNKTKKQLTLLPIEVSPIILQIWSRNPLLPQCKQVDDISLYLTLKNHSDERVQMALDELKEKFYAERT